MFNPTAFEDAPVASSSSPVKIRRLTHVLEGALSRLLANLGCSDMRVPGNIDSGRSPVAVLLESDINRVQAEGSQGESVKNWQRIRISGPTRSGDPDHCLNRPWLPQVLTEGGRACG